jgi:hypothetical protein
MIFCNKCKQEKEDCDFLYKNKITKYCQKCRDKHKIENKISRDKNIDRYRKSNKDYMKRFRDGNKIEAYKRTNNWKNNNKEYIKNYNKKYKKKYYLENKEKLIKKSRYYDNRRKEIDPVYKLRRSISIDIWHALKKRNGQKGSSFLKYLDYTIKELKEHLESQFESWMNWGNQGIYKIVEWDDGDCSTWRWHIDHIIPQSALPYTSMEEENFKKCWTLKNLRPLSAKENLEKGCKVNQSVI